jgi:soluble lytic murein transglycosylase-like protein
MQVMPDTALGDYGIQPDRLWEPRINIRLGLHFLKRLIHRYRGRVDLALSYYNGGAAVGNWPRARIIPATYPYLRKVQQYSLDYQQRISMGVSHD